MMSIHKIMSLVFLIVAIGCFVLGKDSSAVRDFCILSLLANVLDEIANK